MGSEERENRELAWVWKNGGKEEAEGQRGFKCPDLGIESGHTEVCGSALTNVTPSSVGYCARRHSSRGRGSACTDMTLSNLRLAPSYDAVLLVYSWKKFIEGSIYKKVF